MRTVLHVLLFSLIGVLAVLLYSAYPQRWFLLLRLSAIPAWGWIGLQAATRATRAPGNNDRAEEGIAAEPHRVALDGGAQALLWALAHLIPLVWIRYALTRRTLWPFVLILLSTGLARFGQLLVGLPEHTGLALSVGVIPAAAWIGIQLAARRRGSTPHSTGHGTDAPPAQGSGPLCGEGPA